MTTTASGDGLAIDGIHFGYGSQPVLSDISVRIPRGQVLAMMGPSGCGKTTLGRIVAGFLVPSSGTIAVHGTTMVGPGQSVPAHRRRIGMVPQEGALFPHLSVAGNVGFGLARRSPERQARIAECLALVGLEGFGPRRVHELSGGQQQRVAVARALAPRPDLIIMDEPFSALDPLIRKEMQDELIRLQRQEKRTIVFITHDFTEAIRIGDRIAIMKDGVFDQVGTPEDIVARPATDYVREFTNDVPKSKVLTAHAVMAPVDRSAATPDRIVRSTTKVGAIVPLLLDSTAAVGVTNDHGDLVGVVDRDAVSVMLGVEES